MLNKKEFKICPVVTKEGVRYVVKEDKRWGGYLNKKENDITLIEASSARYKDINDIIKTLDGMFGESYVINDNYL